MPSLAWFTPLPPASTGVARYNVELLPGVAASHPIDVFIDGDPGAVSAPAGVAGVFGAHDFVWKHEREPYDLVVYQMGNAPCHDYMWAYVARYPGLAVLHDGQLHHARARSLILQRRDEDYRAEFVFNHPDAEPDLAELTIAGMLGPLTHFWPMRGTVIEASRLVVVHNAWLAARIRDEHPLAEVRVVEMGVPAAAPDGDARSRVRARHAIPAAAVVFTAFGTATPEKRLKEAIAALAAIADDGPDVRLLLVGQAVGHYDPRADARDLGIDDRVTVTGFVPDEEVHDYLAASDVCLCLRWPTSRETSAAWLRCLAAGRATVVTDLAHTVDVPSLDPRTWTVLYGSRGEARAFEPPPPVEAVTVSISVLDEEHSLMLAMRRLARDARLRESLGLRGRRLWLERFTLDRMAAGYLSAIDDALAVPPDRDGRLARLPAHFRTDGAEDAVRMLSDLGVAESEIARLWTEQSG